MACEGRPRLIGMNNVTVEDIIGALNLLLTPSSDRQNTQGNETESNTKDPILEHFQENLQRLQAKLSEGLFHSLGESLKESEVFVGKTICSASSEWHFQEFISCILQLLHLLSSLMLDSVGEEPAVNSQGEAASVTDKKPRRPQDAPPLKKSALSVAHLNTVKTALQFVICLGIYPNLINGVGIPLQHRSKMLTSVHISPVTLSHISQSSQFKKTRLSACVFILAEMFTVPDLQSIIINLHLNDFLAALLQSIYAGNDGKISKQTSADSSTLDKNHGGNVSNKEGPSLAEKSGFVKESCKPDLSVSPGKDRDFVTEETVTLQSSHGIHHKGILSASVDNPELQKKALDHLLSSVSPHLLMRELLVLLSGMPQNIQGARNQSVTPVPAWLKNGCNRLLQRLAKGPKGIHNLYTALTLDSDSGSSTNIRCCCTVAKIISGCPVNHQQIDQHIINISQQLMELLDKGKGHFIQLAGSVASSVSAKYPEQFSRHFHHQLQGPLLRCLQNEQAHVNGTVAASEQEITLCVLNLQKIYVIGQPPLSDIVLALRPVISVLWDLFCLTRSSVYNIKKCIRDLLLSYLKVLGKVEAATCLQQLCLGPMADGAGASRLSIPLCVCFKAGARGSLQAVYAEEDKVTRLDMSQKVEAVTDVLQDVKKDGVAGELIVFLLKDMTEMISEESRQSDILLPPRVQRAEIIEQKKEKLMRKVTLLHLLASLCETFGSECLSNNTQILLFIKVSLERGVAVCRGSRDEETLLFETETITMAMALLTALMAGALEMKEEERTLMDGMMPLLEVIGRDHFDEQVREMADDIRIAIGTRGAVWSSLLQVQKNKGKKKATSSAKGSKKETKKEEQESKLLNPLIEVLSKHSVSDSKKQISPTQTRSKPLIEVLSDQPSSEMSDSNVGIQISPEQTSKGHPAKPLIEVLSDEVSSVPNVPSKKSKVQDGLSAVAEEDLPKEDSCDESGQLEEVSTEKSSLQVAFEELCDPLLPVRGHALITLTRLVHAGDAETLSKKEAVQQVFEINMHHGDPYLYLNAINGMSALADRFPKSVVAFLASEFAGFSEKSASNLTAEHRLKVGEALMKATRNLGEMITVYREMLLASVLSGARDKDATVRASSMSNVAEVCSLLRFSLGHVKHEIFECCKTLLETDEAIVRQAAAMTITKILEGLGKDFLTVLDTVMTDLYRLLKRVRDSDTDEAVQLHVGMALEQIESVARDALFPKQTLQKKIQVLSNADTFK